MSVAADLRAGQVVLERQVDRQDAIFIQKYSGNFEL